jgi:hypothetical protein
MNCLSAGNSFIMKFTSNIRRHFPADPYFTWVSYRNTRCSTVSAAMSCHTADWLLTGNKWLIALITTAYCWQIINKPPMHEPHCPPCNIRVILCRGLQVNLFLHFKRYRPSSMLSHQQNWHALRGRQWTGCGEAQSREIVNSVAYLPMQERLSHRNSRF